jgi:hypothetical protein
LKKGLTGESVGRATVVEYVGAPVLSSAMTFPPESDRCRIRGSKAQVKTTRVSTRSAGALPLLPCQVFRRAQPVARQHAFVKPLQFSDHEGLNVVARGLRDVLVRPVLDDGKRIGFRIEEVGLKAGRLARFCRQIDIGQEVAAVGAER